MHHRKIAPVLLAAFAVSCAARRAPLVEGGVRTPRAVELAAPSGEAILKPAESDASVSRKQAARDLLREISTAAPDRAVEAGRELLAMASEDISPVLHDGLRSENPEVRLFSAKALTGLKDTSAVPEIMRMAEEGGHAEFYSIEMLGELGDARAAPLLAGKLGSDDPAVRAAAAEALASTGGSDYTEAIIGLMPDKEAGVRSRAAKALGTIGDARAAEPLVKALYDREQYVRSAAISALGNVGEPAIPILFDAIIFGNPDYRIECREALAAMGGKALPQLADAVMHGDAVLKYEAIVALGNIGDAHAAGALAAALDDADPHIRGIAANSLRMLGAGAREARPKLAAVASGDPSDFVRAAAGAALESIPN